MESSISSTTLKNAELILRLTMAITLLIAGISKFFSHGNFHDYYVKQFSNKGLRINLPVASFDIYLTLIPFIEIGIGLLLLTSIKRRFFIVFWISYFITLELGHYVLEEFSSANMIIPYVLLGTAAYILPSYEDLWTSKKIVNL